MSSARQRLLATMRPAMVVGFGVTLLLSGCGTGQVTETASQQSAAPGAQGQVGPIAVRNALITYPEGGEHYYRSGSDAPITLTIVNTGDSEDELTSVTSPAAQSVQIEGQRGLPPQHTLRAVAPTKSTGPTQSSDQNLTQGQIRIVLDGLTEDVRPGRTVSVTLLFRQAGELTLQVPVGPPPLTSATSTS